MLEYLRLENVGPAPKMKMELGERLNVITGDNGLGKSFLLDVAWWALTRRWPAEVNPAISSGSMARPFRPGPAVIELSFQAKVKKETYRSKFDRRDEAWSGRVGRPANPGLVLYAQVDGGFAVWDPARNYWKVQKGEDRERQPPFVFSPREVWDGATRPGKTSLIVTRAGGDERIQSEIRVCNGLLADWSMWQKENGDAFRQLSNVLATLSPSNDERLLPGELTKLSIDDARWIPTLRLPYGIEVPVLMISSAMRRILALAYLLVWGWQEHVRAAALLHEPPTRQVTFLIDELECHLHPRWQRTIVSSMLAVMKGLSKEAAVQIIATTHSPLLLASLEPIFDEQSDAWFDLDLERPKGRAEVVLRKRPFIRRGEVSSWLTSEAFDLASARSVEAEVLLERAAEALSDEGFDRKAAQKLDRELRKVLGDTDPFWSRWRFVGERRGWLTAPRSAEKRRATSSRRRRPS